MPTSEQIEAAYKAVEELANMPLGISLAEWSRLSATILAALPKDGAVGAERLEGLREELRQFMIQQPTTQERETYSDGFAQGLAYAIGKIDALTSPSPAQEEHAAKQCNEWPDCACGRGGSDNCSPAQEEDICPVCANPFKSGDLCATDIEMGMCHAACLHGSPTVNLDTGEPHKGPLETFPYVGAKPVAWRIREMNGNWVSVDKFPAHLGPNAEIIPLYAGSETTLTAYHENGRSAHLLDRGGEWEGIANNLEAAVNAARAEKWDECAMAAFTEHAGFNLEEVSKAVSALRAASTPEDKG